MRVLVLGRSGQVASSLAERAAKFPGLALAFASRPEFDLDDEESIRRTIAGAAAGIVVNAAAYTAVDAAEADEAAAFRANGRAPGIVAEAARDASAGLIHLSTDYVFDGRLDRPYREGDAVAPINAYGRTKLAGEEAVRSTLPGHVILRTSWVYSPFGKNFVKTMLALGRTRGQLDVVDDQIGKPTSALDIADAILTIIDGWRDNSGRGAGATYHLAGDGETSWAGFARHIFETSQALGGPFAEVSGIPSAQWPTPAARPLNSRLNSARFVETFGYAPPGWTTSSVEVVRRLLAE